MMNGLFPTARVITRGCVRNAIVVPFAIVCLAVTSCGGGDDDQPVHPVTLAGAIDRPATYSFDDLKAMPATTQTVNYNAGTTPQTHTYTGTNLWGMLDRAGIQLDASRRNDVLNRYVLATGGDRYKIVF